MSSRSLAVRRTRLSACIVMTATAGSASFLGSDVFLPSVGAKPGQKVSWQVTGIRQDASTNAHPIQVEEDKPETERVTFIHAELFDEPEETGIEWVTHPEMRRQIREARDRADNGRPQ